MPELVATLGLIILVVLVIYRILTSSTSRKKSSSSTPSAESASPSTPTSLIIESEKPGEAGDTSRPVTSGFFKSTRSSAVLTERERERAAATISRQNSKPFVGGGVISIRNQSIK